jgi:hypothetical protein
MKSDDRFGNNRNSSTKADDSDKGAYSNTIEVGSVGIEGGTDNGASTLRVLKRKHANDPYPYEKKPRRHFL